jgi:WD40 repeat protein
MHLRSAATGQVLETGDMALSPDGQFVALAASNRVAIWNTLDGTPLHNLDVAQACPYDPVLDIEFQPDGQRLAIACRPAVTIWQVADGRQVLSIPEDDNFGFTSLAFTPNGASLATASGDNLTRVWRLEEAMTVFTATAQVSAFNSLLFSNDGSLLVGISQSSGTFEAWRLPGGETLALQGSLPRDTDEAGCANRNCKTI